VHGVHWLNWLRFLVKPLRRGVIIFVLVLVVEYLVVPELVGARKDLYLLGQMNVFWLIAGAVCEYASLFCYAVLMKVLLPLESRPKLSNLFRIELVAAAVAHVIPAGTLGTAAFGFRLFTAEGVPAHDTAVMLTVKSVGSALVMNTLLWVSLVILIPVGGFQPIYASVAIAGIVFLLVAGALLLGVTRGAAPASRMVRAIGDKLPGLSGERAERAILEANSSLSVLTRNKNVLARAALWAALNWILDAASLWCFVAAFGKLINPVELFAAYGIATVVGMVPVTPGGLGVIDSLAPLLLVGFGLPRNIATLGVLGWRLVNFWLPIPVGAVSYASLKAGPFMQPVTTAGRNDADRPKRTGDRPSGTPASEL
jgi:hypothetical protein